MTTRRDFPVTEFLTARLDEDEANLRDDDWCSGDGGLHVISTRWHERLVADVAAKRRIVERITEGCPHPPRAGGWCLDHCDLILRDLASIYADHPDFDPSWA